MKAATVRIAALLIVTVCIGMCGGCQVQPAPRDLSGFQEFEYESCGGGGDVGDVFHALIIRRTDDGPYSLQMSVVSVAPMPDAPVQTTDLPPRDLTDDEVQRVLAIFSDIRLLPYEPGVMVSGFFPHCFRWDDFVAGTVPGPRHLSHETVSEILALLEDLAASQ